MSQGRDRKTRMERRVHSARARQQSRRRARGTRALNTPKEMARVVPPTFPFRSCTRHIYEKIFEKDGRRTTARSFPTPSRPRVNPFQISSARTLCSPRCAPARLPKAALDITVCALHTHFQAFHTIFVSSGAFGATVAAARSRDAASTGARAVGVPVESPVALMFEHDAADVLCELFGVSFPSAESFSRRDERLI
ncbi:hypothetical protein B0H14DRAFT_2666436 [Mycena olivaceomarginata]|nr:hypothetical protein B0H14DRAFT_2666436 [Mycena olivaceomarginata]